MRSGDWQNRRNPCGAAWKELPRSEQAQRLMEEWRRILDEMARAHTEAEETLREDILPKLQEELEALKKRLKELKPKERRPVAPVLQV